MSSSAVSIINGGYNGWAGHVTRMDMTRSAYRILVRTPLANGEGG
jgi:hypothetical protein